ncbi:choice-of-anchor D domain-containing protein [Candidatus Cloacimonadota bacterium]
MKKAFLTFIILLASVLVFAEWTIVETYSIPEGASGLAFDGTYLYCGIYGANGDEVYRIDPSDGSYQLQFVNSNIGDSFGMTWDGTNLWVTDHVTSPSIPATAYELDINSGAIVSQFDLPAHYMSGIAYDNGNFWVTAYYDPDGEIYNIDNTGAVLQQFAAPDNQPWDLCLENGNLWMADYWGDALYKIDPTTGGLLETHPSEGVDPAGIVWDGQNMWYCDNGSGGFDYLYKVDLGGAGTPAISLGWDEYDFGNTTIGQPESVELPVTNIGAADLVITDLNFTLNDFSTDETLPLTITPGSSENVTIIFNPQVWGQYNCTLTVESNDPVNPSEPVTLSGYGVTDDPSIVVAPTSINYGGVRVGALTGRYINISNQGSGNLEITQFEFDNDQFILDESVELPFTITPANDDDIRIWFNPQSAGAINGTLTIHSNDPAALTVDVALTGNGDNTQYSIGSILWQYTINTGYDNSPKAISPIEDINGDGVGDVIVCSEDNFVRCFNGNASITGDILWEHEISSGDLYQQNALVVNTDLDNDGYDDIVAGTVGGDRAVRAISGKTGQLIWIFNTSSYGGNGGWVYQVDVSHDYNNDGTLDVIAAAGSDAQRVMCLDGTNGNELWNYYQAGPKFSCIGISDINNDGTPDVIGGGSNSTETDGKVWGLDGTNGSQLWEFTTAGSSVWALAEVDDISGNGINDVVAGDFSGNYYAINTFNGSMEWSGSIGTGLIIRFEKLNDVNGNGHPDIAIARSTQDNAIVVDGHTGDNIWLQPVADQPWVVDKIGDITGDGINDIVWGTLFGNNYGYFLNGATGEILSQTPVGSACDAIGGIPDVAGDGSWEMVCGGRNGEVICISGGEAAGVGYLEGTISLDGGPGSVNGMIVHIGTTTVTADENGFYSATLPPGFYDATFALPSYETQIIEDVEIIQDITTTLDVTMNYYFPPQNLTYTISGSDVILDWDSPTTPLTILGWKVYRDGMEIAEITTPTITTYTDQNPAPGIYVYNLTTIYDDGISGPSNVVSVEITDAGNNLLPLITKLNGNHPNPFNPTTKISFDLAEDADVSLQIYNTKGQLVKTLVRSTLKAGYHSANWNGRDEQNKTVASGLYFYKMKTGSYLSIGKCLLLK